VNSTIDELRGSHPELFDNNNDDDGTGNFGSCTSTNGIEGGNWRVKYPVSLKSEEMVSKNYSHKRDPHA
jgi:hypothetical protein